VTRSRDDAPTVRRTGGPLPSTGARSVTARTLPLQPLVNKVVRGLLRAPLLCRLVGRRLVTVYVVGRRSGRRYAVPVAYMRLDRSLLIGSQFGWARNLRSGEPVEVRLAGRRRRVDVRVLTDEGRVVDHLAMMASDNHQFARLNGIRLDRDGGPVREDLHLAWVAGARVALLTPH
jgi:deazaflavin-dependent oxidoreductase (nitroreductase family)